MPVKVKGLNGVVAIAGGFSGGYALLSDGTVWAWGAGAFGQLGNGYSNPDTQADSCDGEKRTLTYYCSSVPVEVKGLNGVIAIAGGANSGYALLSDGTVWAWGGGGWRQLGNGDPQPDSCDTQSTTFEGYCSSVPVEVSGLDDVVAIAGGYSSGVRAALGWRGLGVG